MNQLFVAKPPNYHLTTWRTRGEELIPATCAESMTSAESMTARPSRWVRTWRRSVLAPQVVGPGRRQGFGDRRCCPPGVTKGVVLFNPIQ